MAVDISGVRDAVEEIAGKFDRLRAAITALQDEGGLQDEADAIKARLEQISAELDSIIEQAEGGEEETDVPGSTTPSTPVVDHR